MASIGGVNLHVEDSCNSAGAAFPLTVPARDSHTFTMRDGATCHVTEGRPYFVVTLSEVTASARDEILPIAYETAQRGLDLMAVQGLGDYALTPADDGTVTWWRMEGRTRLRYHVMVAPRLPSLSVNGIVVRSDGSVISAPPASIPEWQPAFRYFRWAQTADDLYDSYRNLYLAFESLLSTYHPHSQADRKWTRAALQEVGDRIDLTPFVMRGSGELVDRLLHEQYEAFRCTLFHAKAGQSSRLPGYLRDRVQVAQAHQHLSALVITLFSDRFGVRRKSSFMTAYAFGAAMRSIFHNPRIATTPETPTGDDQNTSPFETRTGISVLDTRLKGPVDDDQYGPAFELKGKRTVERLCSPLVNGLVVTGSPTDAGDSIIVDQLDLGHVDVLEVRLLIAMNNPHMPRSIFRF